MDGWSRGDKISLVSLLVAVVSAVAAIVVVPDVRRKLGLDGETASVEEGLKRAGLKGNQAVPQISRPRVPEVNVKQAESSMEPNQGPLQVCQVSLSDPVGMRVGWQLPSDDAKPIFLQDARTMPAHLEFTQGRVHRLRLTDIPGRPGLIMYPTFELPQAAAVTKGFLNNNSINIFFTPDDFEYAADAGYLVTKVIIIPYNDKYNELYKEKKDNDTLVSIRVNQDVDPIQRAESLGCVLMVVRLGTRQFDESPKSAKGKADTDGPILGIAPSSMIVKPQGSISGSMGTLTIYGYSK